MNLIYKEAAELLERGADAWESETIKWVQGVVGTREHGVCAIGMCRLQSGQGMDLFSSGPPLDWSTRRAYLQAIRELERRLPDADIAGWNDRKGRSREEVIELFKQTAKDLRNRA